MEFSRIGESRALMPGVNVMALTATAMQVTRKLIIQSLEMSRNCHYIVKVPGQLNITYAVSKKSAQSMKSFTTPLVQELLTKGRNTAKTIVYCQFYPEIIATFQDLVIELDCSLTIKDENGQVTGRLVETYNACTEPSLRSKIVSTFAIPDGLPRVVVENPQQNSLVSL